MVSEREIQPNHYDRSSQPLVWMRVIFGVVIEAIVCLLVIVFLSHSFASAYQQYMEDVSVPVATPTFGATTPSSASSSTPDSEAITTLHFLLRLQAQVCYQPRISLILSQSISDL